MYAAADGGELKRLVADLGEEWAKEVGEGQGEQEEAVGDLQHGAMPAGGVDTVDGACPSSAYGGRS